MESDSEGTRLVPVGSMIGGKYRVDTEIGRGGMGMVVRATHAHLNQPLAIKLLLRATRPNAAARFEREARTTMRLRSEHTVRVLDAGLHGEIPFLVMELLEGSDLRRLLLDRGPLPVDEAAGYVLQVCEALSEAHELGIVHRDIKPANLFLTRRFDGSPIIKVLDFGVAKECCEDADQEVLTTSAVSIGSPMYMAPEQVRDARRVDARADVWSAGVTLFELLTARRPFDAPSVSGLLAAILSDDPRPLRALCPQAPAELERIVRSCLVRNPERRCPSAAALGVALGPFAASWAASSVARLSGGSGRNSVLDLAPAPEQTSSTLTSTEALTSASPLRLPARAFALLALSAGVLIPGALASRSVLPESATPGASPSASPGASPGGLPSAPGASPGGLPSAPGASPDAALVEPASAGLSSGATLAAPATLGSPAPSGLSTAGPAPSPSGPLAGTAHSGGPPSRPLPTGTSAPRGQHPANAARSGAAVDDDLGF